MDLAPLAGYPLGIGVLIAVLSAILLGKLRSDREVDDRDKWIVKLESRIDKLTSLLENAQAQERDQQAMFDRSLDLIDATRGKP